MHLLLQDVGEAARGHAGMVEVLHQDQGVHGCQLGPVIQGLHASILREAGPVAQWIRAAAF